MNYSGQFLQLSLSWHWPCILNISTYLTSQKASSSFTSLCYIMLFHPSGFFLINTLIVVFSFFLFWLRLQPHRMLCSDKFSATVSFPRKAYSCSLLELQMILFQYSMLYWYYALPITLFIHKLFDSRDAICFSRICLSPKYIVSNQ